jgi:hypothetical protein
VVSFVKLAEQTGQSDEAKLAAVLNATEAYVNTALPQLKVDFNTLSVQVKSFVAGGVIEAGASTAGASAPSPVVAFKPPAPSPYDAPPHLAANPSFWARLFHRIR